MKLWVPNIFMNTPKQVVLCWLIAPNIEGLILHFFQNLCDPLINTAQNVTNNFERILQNYLLLAVKWQIFYPNGIMKTSFILFI